MIAKSGDRLRERVQEAAAGEVVPRAAIEAAAATYIVYYRSHIASEDDDILPAAARESAGREGEGERFTGLRRRIAAEAGSAPRTLQRSPATLRGLGWRPEDS